MLQHTRSTKTSVAHRQRRWRKLPAAALAELIEDARRRAGSGKHLSQVEWRELDSMRRHLAKLEGRSCFK